METQKSAIGLDANLTAALGYPINIIALILIFVEKENKFVRFHAIQSLLWTGFMLAAVFVIVIGGAMVTFVAASVSGTLAWMIGIFLGLLYFGWMVASVGGMIYAAVKAYGHSFFKLPVVGTFAEKWNT